MRQLTTELAFIYMTTQVDEERIESDPPELPYDVEDAEHRKDLLKTMKRSAYQYDAYHELVQVSFLWNGCYHHFVFCNDPDIETRDTTGPYGRLRVFDIEVDMLAAVGELLGQIMPTTPDGIPLGAATLAGWKIGTDTVPFLVNRLMSAGLPVPSPLLTDPMRRFTTVDCLLDVSAIYSQGINMSMRRLPAVGDALKYWGLGEDYASPDLIRNAICTDPVKAVEHVQSHLAGMCIAVQQYYGGHNGRR